MGAPDLEGRYLPPGWMNWPVPPSRFSKLMVSREDVIDLWDSIGVRRWKQDDYDGAIQAWRSAKILMDSAELAGGRPVSERVLARKSWS